MSHRERSEPRLGVTDQMLSITSERPIIPHDAQCRDRILAAMELVADRVRYGELNQWSAGVLLDVKVQGIRCILVESNPHGTVVLSPREQQIAVMVAGGSTNQAIASALEISVWTVSTHIRRIFAKLGVCSRAEMVAHLVSEAEFAAQAQQALLGYRARRRERPP